MRGGGKLRVLGDFDMIEGIFEKFFFEIEAEKCLAEF
jgi:hypothetical protein